MNSKSIFRLSLLLLVMVASSATASDGVVKGSVDMRGFFQSYTAKARGETPRFKVPAVWIYSPRGKLVARIDGEQDLARLPAILGAPDADSLSAIDTTGLFSILGQLGMEVPATGKGEWTLALLAGEACTTACAPFRDAIAKASSKPTTNARGIELTLRR